MERITPVSLETAEGKAKQLLDAVKAKLGIVPNMTRAMAVSPSVLEAYLGFSGALAHGVLPAQVGERLALDVGEANRCDYCVSGGPRRPEHLHELLQQRGRHGHRFPQGPGHFGLSRDNRRG